ncbi:universal stress protein [Cryobacterium psychrophilum]|uniref:Universal stress protein n=1 Tax=Cryobacterium psychrophilum TaxID=41988 RepID=A0A4Y8KKN2_9MICO|nr:universal stress protein [Cryobacterium psychrophilum]TDW30494.1 nucleotide-binding universal stress UspA family protein [Cryobacterium psychrophilum]TFD76332.1 universal stress protein [Cryobacterium psychrophilum]
MIEKSIVAWDGRPPAKAALDWALERSAGRELVMVRVVDRTSDSADYFMPESVAETAPITLQNDVDLVQAANPSVIVRSEVLPGDPIEELKRLSAEDTLVVVGTHRRDGPTVRYEWSVGARLAGAANGPVAIIPESDDSRGEGIVVGVDGSSAANAAVAFAAAEAHRTNEELHLVHAWQEPLIWPESTVPDIEFLQSLEDIHRHVLDESVALVGSIYPNVRVSSSLIRGAPQWALRDAARGASLLVVGNHGVHGLKRFLLGSVSHSLVLNIQSPTVVVNATSTL